MIELKGFLTKDSFSAQIEKMVHEEGYNYIDAVIDFAADCDKSPEEMLPFFSTVLLEKVRQYAIENGMGYTSEQPVDIFQ